MLDPLESVLRQLLEEWPDIKAPRVTEIVRKPNSGVVALCVTR